MEPTIPPPARPDLRPAFPGIFDRARRPSTPPPRTARTAPSPSPRPSRRQPQGTIDDLREQALIRLSTPLRGGAPRTSRFRRLHDLTSAQRSCRLRPRPTAEHASAQHPMDGSIPVPPPLQAAAPKLHRRPPRASSHQAHHPIPTARAQRSPTSRLPAGSYCGSTSCSRNQRAAGPGCRSRRVTARSAMRCPPGGQAAGCSCTSVPSANPGAASHSGRLPQPTP